MQTLKNKLSKIFLSTCALAILSLIFPSAALAATTCKTSAKPKGSSLATNKEIQTCLENNPIVDDINKIVNFLAAGVGIVIVGSIIAGGIQYAMAGNSSENVSKARKRISDALLALLAFIFLYAFLQWLIPGGTPLIHL